MIDAGDLPDVIDVIGDVQRASRAARDSPCARPRAPRVTASASPADCCRRGARVRRSRGVFQAATCWETNPGTNVTITTPPFFGSCRRMSSGTLRGTSVSARARRVREDHRRRRHAERVRHRSPARRVTEVDEHAEPVHLAHDLLAERREAVELRRVGRRVGPRHVERCASASCSARRADATCAASRASCRSSGRPPCR